MPCSPTSCRASFTSSSLNGLMTASIFFIAPSLVVNQVSQKSPPHARPEGHGGTNSNPGLHGPCQVSNRHGADCHGRSHGPAPSDQPNQAGTREPNSQE